ncbi:MAG: hypothetical protein AMJ65_13480 [Phycisphaerae bacterium SG8_4]|nr:MAG: hypothetical protein AMJ65_13480 [Phycisphaerae bacterium SG8_4]
MQYLKEIKKWIGEITEISLLLIAFGIVVQILFGDVVPFFGGITTNLTALLNTLGDNGFVALITLGVILYLLQRRRVTD